jgi:porphobilinogen synthase
MNPAQLHTSLKLTRRMRRLRKSDAMRALVRETRLSPDQFILPLFVARAAASGARSARCRACSTCRSTKR